MSNTPDHPAGSEDLAAGRLAIKHNLITQAQLDDCVQSARQLAAAGIHKSVNQVLVDKNYLSQGRLNSLLLALGKVLAEIDQYEVLSKLGEGGMGTVYKVRNKKDGKTGALKTLRGDAVKDKEYLERFKREIQVATSLVHPHIVGATDSGIHKGFPYYVMEYVDGESLEKTLHKKGKLDEIESAYIIIQICQALSHANKHHLVHRDIKPANILITKDRVAKLCDLGIAKSTDGGMTLTQTGYAVGSPHYLSPEQIRGDKKIDIRSDLYSLGITLYQMVTGRLPFDDENPQAVLMKRLNELPPHPTKFEPGLSSRMCAVILKMMAREPAYRYPTPEDLIRDLDPIASGQAEPEVKKPSGRISQRLQAPKRSKRGLFIAAGGIAVAVIGLIAVLAIISETRKGEDQRTTAHRHRQDGQEYFDQQNYTRAISSWEQAVKHDPELATSLRDKINLARARKREADARVTEQATLRLKAQDLADQGKLKYAKNQWEDAMKLWNEAIATYPEIKPTLTILMADAQKKIDEQKQSAIIAEAQRKKDARDLYLKAMDKYTNRQDYLGAITDARAALQLNPDLDDARKLITDAEAAEVDRIKKDNEDRLKKEAGKLVAQGTEKYNRGDYTGAIHDWQEAVRYDRSLEEQFRKFKAKVCSKRGTDKYGRGDYTGAVAEWQEAVKLDPSLDLMLQKQIRDAQEKLKPADPKALARLKAEEHFMTAQKEYNNRKFSEAIAELNQALRLAPDYAEALHLRGMAYDDLTQYKEAIDDLTKAIQLNPRFEAAYNDRGLIKYKQSDFKSALDDFNKAIEISPKYARAHFNRGVTHNALNNKPAAIADWEKAIQLNSSYKDELQPMIDKLKNKK